MPVLLYGSRSALPFGRSPQLPETAFNQRMGGYDAMGWGGAPMVLLKEHPAWPFLIALERACNRMCAHVSFGLRGRTFIGSDYVRVQISTRPVLMDRRGVPAVFDGNGELAVTPIFTRWDHSRSPRPFYMLSPAERRRLKDAPTTEKRVDVWQIFFVTQLVEALHHPFRSTKDRQQIMSGLGLS